MTDHWHKWNDEKPPVGSKFIVAHDDWCSSGIYYMSGEGPLDAEDGGESEYYLFGSIWAYLPDSYPIAFMECHDDY